MDKKKNKTIWKVLLALGILPFILVLCIGIYSSIFGFTFLGTTDVGVDAFIGSIFILSFLYWPIYIVGIFLIIISIVKLKENDGQ